jgi:acetyl-CoA acyltransferase
MDAELHVDGDPPTPPQPDTTAIDSSVNQSSIVNHRLPRRGIGRAAESTEELKMATENGGFGGREVVIVEAVRTPVGRGHEEKGYYKDVHPSNLLAKSYTELIERSGIDASEVEDVVAGCVQQFGEQAFNIGRNAWLEAGLPIETPATTLDRQCGSGQQAVNFAAALIASGVHDVVIGGGVEHMGHISFADGIAVQQEHGMGFSPQLMERYNLVPQGISAELIADQWEIPRSELDEIGLRSHQLAARATEEGRFEREMIPMQVNGDTYTTDQGIRPDSNLEALAALKPAFKEDGKITAGNSSQISDGAAAVLLMSREKADALGLRPRARIVDQTTVGVDPVIMLTGPIPATRRILERNGMQISDIDLIEINEAFASVVAAWRRELEPDMDRVNVNGGAIAIGHPLGSTGARLLTTLLHELERDDKQTGLVTMCCGGGLGTGTLIERI